MSAGELGAARPGDRPERPARGRRFLALGLKPREVTRSTVCDACERPNHEHGLSGACPAAGECPDCEHGWALHRRSSNGAYACVSFGCGCRDVVLPDDLDAPPF